MRSVARRILTVATLAWPILTSADPVRWSGNGHFYEAVVAPGAITWEEASAAATAAGGYLATITSSAENAFVFSLVNNVRYWQGASGPWLGGYQSPATQQPGSNWRWVTGEPWTYTNWQAGQPNDSGGKAEDKLQFGFASLTSNWNDIMSIDPVPQYRPIAYVIEWDSDPLAPTLQIGWAGTGPQIDLCWQTVTNRHYQLIYASGLTNSQWVPLNSIWVSGDGTTHCQTDTLLLEAPQRFYRLVCTNAPPD